MKRIALAAMFLSASCAYASDWVPAGNTADMEVFLDRQSIARSGSMRKAWIAYSHKDPQIIIGKNYKSTKSLELFSCSEKTSGAYQMWYYAEEYAKGDVVHNRQIAVKSIVFSDVVPDSIGEGTLNLVCRAVLPST